VELGKLYAINWDEKFEDTKYLTHNFHPYFAKFAPQLPNQLIRHFTNQHEIVMDPFCGSGTTLVESCLLGRNCIGVDRNPLACLIAKVKTTSISQDRLAKIEPFFKKLVVDINKFYHQTDLTTENKNALITASEEKYEIPDFPNRDYWFNNKVLHELSIIRAHILQLTDENLKDFLKVGFSRIITSVSNQYSESRYCRVEKKIRDREPFERFRNTTETMKKGLSHFAEKRKDAWVRVLNEDTRYMSALKSSSVDFMVTSPPYLNAWDYNLYQRFRFYWLDLDPIDFKKNEIGAHLQHYNKEGSVQKYQRDMSLCLSQVSRILKTNKYVCIVNSSATIHKQLVDTSKMIVEEASKYNLDLAATFDRTVYGPHYGMVASMKTKKLEIEKKKHKKEEILILKKN
jgi:site-specific DNA-methyltransferase (cytosine-N4-specific)